MPLRDQPAETASTDYQRTVQLLTSQETALERGDSQRLAALAPLLEKYVLRLQRHTDRLADLTERERQEIDVLATEIRHLAANNRRSWEERLECLRQESRQIEAAQRFLEEARRKKRRASCGFEAIG